MQRHEHETRATWINKLLQLFKTSGWEKKVEDRELPLIKNDKKENNFWNNLE